MSLSSKFVDFVESFIFDQLERPSHTSSTKLSCHSTDTSGLNLKSSTTLSFPIEGISLKLLELRFLFDFFLCLFAPTLCF